MVQRYLAIGSGCFKIKMALICAFLSVLPNVVIAADIARTPPMGWSSWNAFHGGINEAVITNITDLLVSTGSSTPNLLKIVVYL